MAAYIKDQRPAALPDTTLTTIEAARDWLHAHGWNTDYTQTHEPTGRGEPGPWTSTRIDRTVDGVMNYAWCHDDAEIIAFAQRQEYELVALAAPDLLVALKQMRQVVDVLSRGIGRMAVPDGFFALFNEATIATARAIRKAEAAND